MRGIAALMTGKATMAQNLLNWIGMEFGSSLKLSKSSKIMKNKNTILHTKQEARNSNNILALQFLSHPIEIRRVFQSSLEVPKGQKTMKAMKRSFNGSQMFSRIIFWFTLGS